MKKEHHYSLTVNWIGNSGTGTSGYKEYKRSHTISAAGKPVIEGSSDPAFMGDASKYNPEELLLSSLSTCHMMWFLHLCADSAVIVTSYIDNPFAVMEESPEGGGRFISVTLNPTVTVTDHNMAEKTNALHKRANERCFIANSVNFPVMHEAKCIVETSTN